jgi:hypothetical protein
MLAYIVRLGTLALCALTTPATVHAWTEAQVTSAAAQLDVTEAGHARVELEIGVQVSGGWLSRFELLDLDDDLEPSRESPALFVGADGRTYSPTTIVPKPGSVELEFADPRDAPRVGDYSLRFTYTSRSWRQRAEQSAHAVAPGPLATWSLPRWPVRLGNVYIRVLAPKGTRPAYPDDREPSDEVTVRELSGAVELSFRRVELPRTQSFSVSFELPGQAHASRPFAPNTTYLPSRTAVLLGLALGLLWLAKRRWSLALCREQGLIALPLVAIGSARLRCYAGFALCASAVPLFAELPVLAAIGGVLGAALSIDIAFAQKAAAPTAPTTPRGKSWYTRLAIGASTAANWLDITTPVGCCACVACYALLTCLYPLAAAPVSCSAWLAAPLFFTATRAAQRRALAQHGPAAERHAAERRAPRAPSPANPGPQAVAQTACGHVPASVPAQPAFLRSSSTTVSSSLSSRPTTSG